MGENLSTIAILNGACFIFQLVGGLLISLAGGYVTFVMTTTEEAFTSNESNWYVADPMFVSACAGIISAVIAVAFMVIFNQTADTLLYCFIYDKKNPKNRGYGIEYAPSGLQALIDETSSS